MQCDLARKSHARPTFTDCAARYVAQSRSKRSIDVIRWHVTLLRSYIGDLELQQIHDQTLEPFVKAKLADGASATTINRSLEVVRTILNRAARSYRDADGRPWLEALVDCGSTAIASSDLSLPFFRGGRINTMNNNGWQRARRDVGLPLVRVHDLRHNSGFRIIPSCALSLV